METRAPKILVACENCGKEFYRSVNLIKGHIFCSNKCRASVYSNKVKIVCKVCGKEFYWRASRLKYYNTECCSKECSGISRRERIKRICKGCGKEFEIRKSHIIHSDGKQRALYCSKECYTEFARGKNSHMYDHGQTFYPYCEKFDERLKERVRHFFGDTCVICGATKEQNKNKRMDVHHVFIEKLACCESKIEDKDLVRLRLPQDIACFGQPDFSDLELLYIRMMVPLCQSCHVKIHHESNDAKFEETVYRKMFSELIITVYGGRCSIEKKSARVGT